MKVINDKVYALDDALPSARVVEPGEVFKVELKNAFGKSFETEEEFIAFLSDGNEGDKKRLNHPCTGPIEINTQETNISLAIHILETKAVKGYQCLSKTTGFLKDLFPERSCRIVHFDDDQKISYKEGDLIIKTHPKIGFISTLDGEVRSVGRASNNGGNLDLNYLDKGSIIYLPVNSSRPRLLVGDLHACQGNGEAAGIAIEADGEVTMKVDIVHKLNFPVIDDKHRMIIVGWGPAIEDSLRQSVINTLDYFKRVFPFCDWEKEDIYKLISAEGNLVLGNSTGKITTCGMVFYKERLYNKHNFRIFH